MINYLKLYGPLHGCVALGVGMLFFVLNVLMIEVEGTSMRLLMFTPVPLVLTGISLLIFPGLKLSKKEVEAQGRSFWSESPGGHRIAWIMFGILSLAFLAIQVPSILGGLELPVDSCFLEKYLGIGHCG